MNRVEIDYVRAHIANLTFEELSEDLGVATRDIIELLNHEEIDFLGGDEHHQYNDT